MTGGPQRGTIRPSKVAAQDAEKTTFFRLAFRHSKLFTRCPWRQVRQVSVFFSQTPSGSSFGAVQSSLQIHTLSQVVALNSADGGKGVGSLYFDALGKRAYAGPLAGERTARAFKLAEVIHGPFPPSSYGAKPRVAWTSDMACQGEPQNRPSVYLQTFEVHDFVEHGPSGRCPIRVWKWPTLFLPAVLDIDETLRLMRSRVTIKDPRCSCISRCFDAAGARQVGSDSA